jgi:hypothetical protein
MPADRDLHLAARTPGVTIGLKIPRTLFVPVVNDQIST